DHVVNKEAVVYRPHAVPTRPTIEVAAEGDHRGEPPRRGGVPQGAGHVGFTGRPMAVDLDENVGDLVRVPEQAGVVRPQLIEETGGCALEGGAVVGRAVRMPNGVSQVAIHAVEGPAVAVDHLGDGLPGC